MSVATAHAPTAHAIPTDCPENHTSITTGPDSEPPTKARHTRVRKKQPNKRPEFLDHLPTPTWPPPYVIEDGLRRVLPYHHTYVTWVKERWRGRKLSEVFEDEFREHALEYYLKRMEDGTVLVNGKPASPDHVLKNGEVVSHVCHRHEPPVTSQPIQVLHEDDEIIVLNKPSGVPVHPSGRYNFNSVIEIMRSERGPEFKAHPCNRLDRLTSGIMFIGKSTLGAQKMASQIQERTVRKEYLARVMGRFPDGEVVCNEPILQISPKLGLNRVRATGKASRTVFKRLAYYPPVDGDTAAENQWPDKAGYSIVRCLPVTGRTHQLRVHLQHLGHPIQNDPIYANYRVWGQNLNASDGDASIVSDEDAIDRLNRMGKDEVADAVAYYDEMVDEYHKKKAEKMTGTLCEECDAPLYTDPGSHELELWLHSLRYEDAANGEWSYTSPLPTWALPPDGMNGPTNVGGMEDLVGAVKETNPELA